MLCDCGYHFQTKRVLDKTEAAETDDDEAAAHVAALRGDGLELPPRTWLLRAAVLLRLLAFLGAAGTVVWSGLLLSAWVKSDTSSSAAQSDATSTLITLLVVLVGGAVQFVLMMGWSEAATALRELERHAFARRRGRPGDAA